MDTLLSNQTNSIEFNLNFNENITSDAEWKWSQYIMDNNYTNPFNIWSQNNCPDYPSQQLFQQMREQEVDQTFIEIYLKIKLII